MEDDTMECERCKERVTTRWFLEELDLWVCEECFNAITGQYPPEPRPRD